MPRSSFKSPPPAVLMSDIHKRFGDVQANNGIDLEVKAGEIHALLGENGAGKTTLMNCLYGLVQADSGLIEIHGRPVNFSSPGEAIGQRVAMVHQHFKLVPRFTVVENVILGLPTPDGITLSTKGPAERILRLSKTYNLKVDPYAEVSQLSVGEQQRVEIIKALYRDADILILDEPTSVLTPQETDQIFEILRTFVREGHSVIFISHKLDEVLKISNRITVLRDGKVVGTTKAAQATKGQLAYMMVAREVSLDFGGERSNPGDCVLELDQVWTTNTDSQPGLRGVSLKTNKGEILGIAGVDGNGQRELAEAIIGLIRVVKGSIRLDGKDISNQTSKNAIALGISMIPENRHERGMLPDLPVWRSLLLGSHDRAPYANNGLHSLDKIRLMAKRLLREFDVRPANPEWIANSLSGGNQQKIIFAREIDRHPKLLIAAQPTRGLDVVTTKTVCERLIQERERGTAILLISTELSEIISLSDRVIVLYEGKVMGTLLRDEIDTKELGLMMAGEPQINLERPNGLS